MGELSKNLPLLVIRILLAVVFFATAWHSVLLYSDYRLESRIRTALRSPESKPSELRTLLERPVSRRAPSSLRLARTDGWLRLAALEDAEMRNTNLCEAVRSARAASEAGGSQAEALARFAVIRAELPDGACTNAGTREDAKEAAAEALRDNPRNPVVLYSAGRAFLLLGERKDGFRAWRDYLHYADRPSRDQIRELLTEARNGEELTLLLPNVFPQLLDSVELLRDTVPVISPAVREALGVLYTDALSRLQDQWSKEEVSGTIAMRHLSRLERLAPPDFVRQRADDLMSRILLKTEGGTRGAAYLDLIARLVRVPIMTGRRFPDFRPATGPLATWNSDEPIYLDDAFASVGFYLPRDESFLLLEFHVAANLPRLPDPLPVQLYWSDDNETWNEERPQSIDVARVGETFRVLIHPPKVDARYWKIHFADPARRRRLFHRPRTMLHAYRSPRGDGGGEVCK